MVNIENFKKVLRLIKATPAKQIKMQIYLGIPEELVSSTVEKIIHSCTTFGCLRGWATLAFYLDNENKSIQDPNYLAPLGEIHLLASIPGFHGNTLENWLEIRMLEGVDLWHGKWRTLGYNCSTEECSCKSLSQIKKADVIRELQYIIKTGEI